MTCQRSVVFPVSPTNKDDRHYITEILLKVVLSCLHVIFCIISYETLQQIKTELQVNYFCLIQSEQFVLALSWQEQISFH